MKSFIKTRGKGKHALHQTLFVGFLALLVLPTATAGVYINLTFPALDGELKAAGLKAPASIGQDKRDHF